MESILTSIKKLLGIAEDYTQFDADIIMHINTVLMDLNGLGVGPSTGFIIEDDTTTWIDFISNPKDLQAVKSYMYLRVKLLFDSATLSSAVISSMEKQIEKFEWLLNVAAENKKTSGVVDENVSEEIQTLIAQLESENEGLKLLNSELTTANTSLTTKVSTLEKDKAALEADNADLHIANNSLLTRNENLETQNGELLASNEALENQLEELESNIKPEQEKAVTITENGTTEVLPDESNTLSKVAITVDVETGNPEAEATLAEIEGSINDSGVLESTDGTATEKVVQLIDKAEDDNCFRLAIENNTQTNGLMLFKGYKGTKIPYFGTLSTKNTSGMFNSATNVTSIDFYIDCPNSTSGQGMFYGTASLKYLKGVNCINMTTAIQMFASSGIEVIEEPLNVPKVTSFTNAFGGSIKEIRFVAETIKVSIKLSSAVLSDESIQSILNGLATVETEQVLALHSNIIDKLSDEKWFAALDAVLAKNWSIE